MNKLIAAVLIIALNLLLSQFLPWWNFIPAVMLVVLIMRLKGSASWMIPAVALMLSWLVQLFLLDQKTGFRSSGRIADIFEAPGLVSYLIPIIGVGVLGALSGYISYLFSSSVKKDSSPMQSEMTLDDYKETQPDLRNKDIL